MDYYHVLIYSDNLQLLNQVCSEFHVLLQSKAFWKERSEKERIEPEVTCLQEWLRHREASLVALQERPEIFLTIMDKEVLPAHLVNHLAMAGIKFDDICRGEVRLNKEKGFWSTFLVFRTFDGMKCSILSRTINDQEKQRLVYRVKRGVQINII